MPIHLRNEGVSNSADSLLDSLVDSLLDPLSDSLRLDPLSNDSPLEPPERRCLNGAPASPSPAETRSSRRLSSRSSPRARRSCAPSSSFLLSLEERASSNVAPSRAPEAGWLTPLMGWCTTFLCLGASGTSPTRGTCTSASARRPPIAAHRCSPAATDPPPDLCFFGSAPPEAPPERRVGNGVAMSTCTWRGR